MTIYRSLRHALTVNFIMLAVLPVLLFGLLILYMWSSHLEMMSHDTSRRLASEVRSDAQFFLVEARRELEQIGQVLDQKGLIRNPSIDDYLTTVAQNSLSFEAILLVDHSWQVRHLGLADMASGHYDDYLGLDMSRHELLESGSLDAPRWSATFLSLISGNPTVTLGVPLEEGVLLGNISLKNLAKLITRLVHTADHVSLAIVDLNKNVIASNRTESIFEQVNFGYHPEINRVFEEGLTTEDVHSSRHLVESVLNLPETGWIIWVGQDIEQVMAPARELRQTLLGFLGLTLLVALVVALRKSKLLMAPISELLQRTVEIGDGTYVPADVRSSYLEIEALSAGMKDMAEAIEEREENLRDSEERFRLMFSLNPDPTMLVRISDEAIVDVNDILLQEVGLGRDELIGKNTSEMDLWVIPKQREMFFEKLRQKRHVSNFGARVKSVTGPRDALISATMIHLEGVDYVLSMIRDISVIREAEAALRDSESRYRTVIESIEEGLIVFNLGGEVIACNRSAEKVFGPRDELIGRSLRHPVWQVLQEDGSRWSWEELPAVRALLHGEHVQHELMRVEHGDDRVSWIEGSAVPIREADNNEIIAAVVTFTDVSERRKHDELLESIARGVSAATGNAYFESLGKHLVATLDADYVIVSEINNENPDYFRTISVVTPRRVEENIEYLRKGTPCQEVIAEGLCVYKDKTDELFPEDKLLAEMGIKAYIGAPLKNAEGQILGLLAVLYKDPLWETTLIEQLLQIFASRAAAELERRHSTIALRHSEQFNRMLIEESPLPMIAINLDKTIRFVNPALEELAGFMSEDLIGLGPPYPYWPEEGHADYEKAMDLIRREEVVQFERLFQAKDGTPFWVDISGAMVTSDEGEKFHLANWVDITSRKEAEQALQNSEKQLRRLTEEFEALLEGIPDQILLVDRDYQLIWANHNPQKDSDMPLGTCHKVFYDKDAPCEKCPVTGAFTSGQVEEMEVTAEEGQHFLMRAVPIKNAAGDVEKVIQIVQDITEKVRLQQHQQHTGQLAALGELAAGVAHEINNPVNGIINYAQLVQNRFGEDEKLRQLTERIIVEGNRIATIVSELLYFAREGGDELRLTSWKQIVDESMLLVGNQLRKDQVKVAVEMSPEMPAVHSISTQLQQVFLNLVSNARHALNDKYPGADPEKHLQIHGRGEPGGKVVLEVTDFGTGIPENTLKKVIQPFYTTKPAGVGTGLGLSICHEIIKRHGGTIRLTSDAGEYTQVRITLPEASEERRARAQHVTDPAVNVEEGTME